MRAALFLIRIVSLLLWWDLSMKIRIIADYRSGVAFIHRSVCRFANVLFAQARATTGIRLNADIAMLQDLPVPFTIVSNHQSVIDIVAIFAAFQTIPVRFVAKKELEYGFPAVSQVLRIQRHALVDRNGNFGDAMRKIEGLARIGNESVCPVIFPEGTRSRDGVLRAFHSGAVRRVLKVRPMPMVAIALDGGYRFTSLADIAKIPRNHQYNLKVVAIFPAPADKTDTGRNLEIARSAIGEQLYKWRVDTRVS